MDIRNRKILIVGGGSGMGLAFARQCLDRGARVVIAGRSEARLSGARNSLGHPDTLKAMLVDIAQEDDVAALFERIGRLDHIVSTAADIGGAYQLLPQLDLTAV
jgi:NAD(P)-dependent dehydrogenase (short-subunit alcohol dehydrogenase family)